MCHGPSRRRNPGADTRRAAARLRRGLRSARRRIEPRARRRALRDRGLRAKGRVRLHRARSRRLVREHGQRRQKRSHSPERHRGHDERLRHERLRLRSSLRQPLELASELTATKRDAVDAADQPAASLIDFRTRRRANPLRATRWCREARRRSSRARTCDRRHRDRRSASESRRPSPSPLLSRAAFASCRSGRTRTRRA